MDMKEWKMADMPVGYRKTSSSVNPETPLEESCKSAFVALAAFNISREGLRGDSSVSGPRPLTSESPSADTAGWPAEGGDWLRLFDRSRSTPAILRLMAVLARGAWDADRFLA